MSESTGWERVRWYGNPTRRHECWRKKFGHGHVHVGIGDFTLVLYCYGANSDSSLSGTRWLYDTIISEEDMMAHIDRHNGKAVPYPVSAEVYRQWWESLADEVKDAVLGVGQPWHDTELERHQKMMEHGRA